jgi:hypothetical protein
LKGCICLNETPCSSPTRYVWSAEASAEIRASRCRTSWWIRSDHDRSERTEKCNARWGYRSFRGRRPHDGFWSIPRWTVQYSQTVRPWQGDLQRDARSTSECTYEAECANWPVWIDVSTVVSQSNALHLSRVRTLPPCRTLKQEKKDIRLAIMPLLQAEEDVRYVKQVR